MLLTACLTSAWSPMNWRCGIVVVRECDLTAYDLPVFLLVRAWVRTVWVNLPPLLCSSVYGNGEVNVTPLPRIDGRIERRILPVTCSNEPFALVFFRDVQWLPKKPLRSKFRSNISVSSTFISERIFCIKFCGDGIYFVFIKNTVIFVACIYLKK